MSIAADGNLGPAPGTATPASLVLSGGTLQTTGAFALSANRGIALGPAGGAGSGTITVGGTLTYGGMIADNGGPGGLVKAGAGTLILTAANTYSGGTSITNGTLQLGSNTSGQDGTLSDNIVNSAVLAFNLFGNQTFSGAISGGGAFMKSGGGMLTLVGPNGYSGSTTVSAGTLQLGGAGALGSSAVNVQNGGVLDLNGHSVGGNALTLSGAASAAAVRWSTIPPPRRSTAAP